VGGEGPFEMKKNKREGENKKDDMKREDIT
jgi:hypothetical protein